MPRVSQDDQLTLIPLDGDQNRFDYAISTRIFTRTLSSNTARKTPKKCERNIDLSFRQYSINSHENALKTSSVKNTISLPVNTSPLMDKGGISNHSLDKDSSSIMIEKTSITEPNFKGTQNHCNIQNQFKCSQDVVIRNSNKMERGTSSIHSPSGSIDDDLLHVGGSLESVKECMNSETNPDIQKYLAMWWNLFDKLIEKKFNRDENLVFNYAKGTNKRPFQQNMNLDVSSSTVLGKRKQVINKECYLKISPPFENIFQCDVDPIQRFNNIFHNSKNGDVYFNKNSILKSHCNLDPIGRYNNKITNMIKINQNSNNSNKFANDNMEITDPIGRFNTNVFGNNNNEITDPIERFNEHNSNVVGNNNNEITDPIERFNEHNSNVVGNNNNEITDPIERFNEHNSNDVGNNNNEITDPIERFNENNSNVFEIHNKNIIDPIGTRYKENNSNNVNNVNNDNILSNFESYMKTYENTLNNSKMTKKNQIVNKYFTKKNLTDRIEIKRDDNNNLNHLDLETKSNYFTNYRNTTHNLNYKNCHISDVDDNNLPTSQNNRSSSFYSYDKYSLIETDVAFYNDSPTKRNTLITDDNCKREYKDIPHELTTMVHRDNKGYSVPFCADIQTDVVNSNEEHFIEKFDHNFNQISNKSENNSRIENIDESDVSSEFIQSDHNLEFTKESQTDPIIKTNIVTRRPEELLKQSTDSNDDVRQILNKVTEIITNININKSELENAESDKYIEKCDEQIYDYGNSSSCANLERNNENNNMGDTPIMNSLSIEKTVNSNEEKNDEFEYIEISLEDLKILDAPVLPSGWERIVQDNGNIC